MALLFYLLLAVLAFPVLIVALLLYNYVDHKLWAKRHGIVHAEEDFPILGFLMVRLKQTGGWKWMHLGLNEKYGPCYSLSNRRIAVVDAQLALNILVTNKQYFQERRAMMLFTKTVMKDSLLTLKGERWSAVRKVIRPVFTPIKIRNMHPGLIRCADQLVASFAKERLEVMRLVKDGAQDYPTIEIRRLCCNYTLDAIAQVAFSMQTDSYEDKQGKFAAAATDIIKAFDPSRAANFGTFLVDFAQLEFFGRLLPTWMLLPSSALDGFKYFADLANDIILKRLRDREGDVKYNDFLQHVMELRAAGQLTDDEMLAQCAVFLAAGFETTATALTFMLFALADNPQCQETLYDEIIDRFGSDGDFDYDVITEMKYLDCFVNEALRLYVPVQSNDRLCNEDCVINGYTFPKGTHVFFPSSLHVDDRYWVEPKAFQPERFEDRSQIVPGSFMPFGGGHHVCIGQSLAYHELKVGLCDLVRKYKFNHPPGFKGLVEDEMSIFLRAKGGVRLIVQDR